MAVERAVDLLGGSGIGPLWGLASTDLNATLLAWPPGRGVAEHVNAELDVLLVVLDGHGSAIIDGETHELAAGSAILIPRATRRAPSRPATPACATSRSTAAAGRCRSRRPRRADQRGRSRRARRLPRLREQPPGGRVGTSRHTRGSNRACPA